MQRGSYTSPKSERVPGVRTAALPRWMGDRSADTHASREYFTRIVDEQRRQRIDGLIIVVGARRPPADLPPDRPVRQADQRLTGSCNRWVR